MAHFVPYSINSGKYNMEYDEKLLDYAIENKLKEPILRFYGWSPACVSLGRNQKETQIHKDYCKKNGVDIVHRLTGGRALLHDEELTYSFITSCDYLKNGGSVCTSYKEISGALIEGFKDIGIELSLNAEKKTSTKFEYCMSISTGADLSFEGKKLIGSAQFRKQNYILQHGSILVRYDREKIKNIFGETPDVGKITCLDEIKTDLEIELLCSSVKIGFENYFNLIFSLFKDDLI